jgi:EpsG family
MEFYYIFYFLQLAIIYIARGLGLKNNNSILLALIVIATLFAGLRGNNGTDVRAYKSYYDEVGAQIGDTVFEPSFYLLAIIGNGLQFSSQFLIFAAAALQGLFIYLTIREIKEKDYYYLLFIANYFVHLQMNTIRVGLALCMLGYALVLNGRRHTTSVQILIGSILTHVTAAFAIVIFMRRWYRVIPVAALAIIVFQDFFISKLVAYFISSDIVKTANDRVGIGFLASLAIIIYCITVENKWSDRKIKISFFAFAIFKMSISFVPALDRVSLVFGLPLVLLLLRDKVQDKTRLALTPLIAYNTYGSLSFIANSDASVDSLLNEFPGLALLYSDTHWIPYEFFWK